MPSKGNANLLIAKSLNIGYYVVTPLFVGVFLGLILDKIFKTKGVFVLILILLGTVGSFYNLYKLVKDSQS